MKCRRILPLLLVAHWLAAGEPPASAQLSLTLDPPRPSIVVEPRVLQGGQQAKVSVRLSSASQVSATGQLSMTFTPSAAGRAADAGILFSQTGTMTIPFTVAKGEEIGRFSGRTETEFQTGTTAGAIVFTAKLGPYSEQLPAVVPAGFVVVDSASATRTAAGVELQLTGFDTSRSISVLSFTFYDGAVSAIAPGLIQVDASRAFRQHFDTTEMGSLFTLRAMFPVTGDSSQVRQVKAELNNSKGTTATDYLTIR